MRIVHFYCATDAKDFGGTEYESPSALVCVNSMLTRGMVDHVIAQRGLGKPPFKCLIPRHIAWNAGEWAMKHPLLDVTIIPGKPDTNTDPFDAAEIHFDDCVAVIHARRSIPCLMSCDP